MINPKPKFNPNAARTFLATLPAKEAAQVAGSFEKRRRILEDKDTLEGIYNEGKDELYKWKRVGDVGRLEKMKADKIKALAASGAVAPEPPVKPATPAEIEAFVAEVLSNRSNNKGRLVLDVVSNTERQRIQAETGVDVGESSKILLPSTIIHATNEHPNLTPVDWRQIADVLREFEGVFLSLDKGRNQELHLAFIKLADTPEAYGCVVDVAKGKKRGGPRLNVATFYRDHINRVLSLVRQSAAKKDEVDRFVAQLSAQGKLPNDRLLRSTPPAP